MTRSLRFPLAGFCSAVLAVLLAGSSLSAQDESAPQAPALRLNQTPLPAQTIALWKTPEFQQRFTESYIAENELEPRVTDAERVVLQEILGLISEEQLDQAINLLEREKNANINASAVFDFTLANIHFQTEELDLALEGYNAAVTKYPKYRRAWKNLGVIYVRQSKFNEAIPALIRSIEMGDNNGLSYGLLGYAYSSVDNFLSAETAYRMAILLDPQTQDWKLGLARAFFKQERFNEAIALTKQLLDKEPERVDLWLLQANAHLGLGEPLEAAEIYELVDMLGGSTVDTLNILGDIYVNEQLFELAANSYLKAMEMEPEKNEDRAIRAARILAARGAIEDTQRLVAKIEELHTARLTPEARKDLLKLRSRLAVAKGAADEEVKILEEIIALDPLDGEALILLGQNSSRTGDNEKAIFYYERAAQLEAFEADAKVRHAQLLVGMGNYAQALPLLRRAQQINYRENIQDFLEQVERVSKSRQ